MWSLSNFSPAALAFLILGKKTKNGERNCQSPKKKERKDVVMPSVWVVIGGYLWCALAVNSFSFSRTNLSLPRHRFGCINGVLVGGGGCGEAKGRVELGMKNDDYDLGGGGISESADGKEVDGLFDLQSFDLETFRSGFVTIVGAPNMGKSTLMNVLMKEVRRRRRRRRRRKAL